MALTEHVVVRFHGATFSLALEQALGEFSAARAEQGSQGIILDFRQQDSRIHPFEMILLVDRLAGFPQLTRFAVLHGSGAILPEDLEFLENLAYNRGILLRSFQNEDLARAWLGSKD